MEDKKRFIVQAYSDKEDGWAWAGEAKDADEALAIAAKGANLTVIKTDEADIGLAHGVVFVENMKEEPRWGVWHLLASEQNEEGFVTDVLW